MLCYCIISTDGCNKAKEKNCKLLTRQLRVFMYWSNDSGWIPITVQYSTVFPLGGMCSDKPAVSILVRICKGTKFPWDGCYYESDSMLVKPWCIQRAFDHKFEGCTLINTDKTQTFCKSTRTVKKLKSQFHKWLRHLGTLNLLALNTR